MTAPPMDTGLLPPPSPLTETPARIPGLPEQRSLLSARCRVGGMAGVGHRLRLYGDRLVITGWRVRGCFRHEIPLEHLLRVEHWPAGETATLVLVLQGGKELAVEMRRGACLWLHTLRNLRVSHAADA